MLLRPWWGSGSKLCKGCATILVFVDLSMIYWLHLLTSFFYSTLLGSLYKNLYLDPEVMVLSLVVSYSFCLVFKHYILFWLSNVSDNSKFVFAIHLKLWEYTGADTGFKWGGGGTIFGNKKFITRNKKPRVSRKFFST